MAINRVNATPEFIPGPRGVRPISWSSYAVLAIWIALVLGTAALMIWNGVQ